MLVKFHGFEPDKGYVDVPTIAIAYNLTPVADGRWIISQQPSQESSLGYTTRPTAAIIADEPSSNTYRMVGCQNTIEHRSGSTLYDLSRTGGYTLTAHTSWEFTQFGTKILACHASGFAAGEAPQIQVIEADGFSPATSNFADVGGGAPSANTIATIRDHVVVGGTYDSTDGYVPWRVRWCAFGDHTSWTVDATTSADIQDLPYGGGTVTKITGGEYGMVYQSNGRVTKMTYEGPPTVYRFDLVIEELIVTAVSVVRVDNVDYMHTSSGFKSVDSNGQIGHIGAGRVDNWAVHEQDNATQTYGAYDPDNNSVCWMVEGGILTAENGSKFLLCYHIALNVWWVRDVSSFGTDTVQLDNLHRTVCITTPLTMYTGNGGGTAYRSFTYDAKFTSSSFTSRATVETSEFEVAPGRFGTIQRVAPIVSFINNIGSNYAPKTDPGINVTHRYRQIGSNYSNTSMSSSFMTHDIRSDTYTGRNSGRFHRLQLTIQGQRMFIEGIDIREMKPGGKL